MIRTDYSPTHIHNPLWPPHAKFHNGQTMSLSTLLSVTSLYLLFRSPSSLPEQRHNLNLSVWIGSLYMLAGLSAIWYPGTAWMDVEFRKVESVDEPNQLWVFGGGLAVLWVGWLVERRRGL